MSGPADPWTDDSPPPPRFRWSCAVAAIVASVAAVIALIIALQLANTILS
jgi:hypothetical protein